MALNQEREQCNLNQESLASDIHGLLFPKVPLSRVREIKEKVVKFPNMVYPRSSYFDNREDHIKRSVKFGISWHKFSSSNSLTADEYDISLRTLHGLHPLSLNFIFVIPSLQIQSTEEQYNYWAPQINSLEIIGCYAQTELGHGSNVKGIETTAYYNHQSQEFIFNTPTVSSYKWWIGALGLCANYALIIAQLWVKDKCFGPHAFFIPIRDIKSHQAFPGVEIGEIGPKIGLNHMDNGYLKLDNYRVGKLCMLNRFSKINPAGDYELHDRNSIKILYLSLVMSRVGIASGAWFSLSIGLTIAIRYSIVRRQFLDPEFPGQEKKLLDYQIQQYKLFKPLGFLYGGVFCRKRILEYAFTAKKEVEMKSGKGLDLAHGISSLFKAFITKENLEGIESARVSCGGHGYSMLSGLPSLYTNYLPSVTFEGDNNILAIQAIKYIASLKVKKCPVVFAFLYCPPVIPAVTADDFTFLTHCFEAVARLRVNNLLQKYVKISHNCTNKEKIWSNYLQVQGIEAAESVFYALFHKFYVQGIEDLTDPKNKQAISELFLLYSSDILYKYKGDLVFLGVPSRKLEEVREKGLKAFESVRKNALGLIEAFEIQDEVLNSDIGSKQGCPYEALYTSAKTLNPISNNQRLAKEIKELLSPKL